MKRAIALIAAVLLASTGLGCTAGRDDEATSADPASSATDASTAATVSTASTTSTSAADTTPTEPRPIPETGEPILVPTFGGVHVHREVCMVPRTVEVYSPERELSRLDRAAAVAFGGLAGMDRAFDDWSRSIQVSIIYTPVGVGGGTVLDTSLDEGTATIDVSHDWLDVTAGWGDRADPETVLRVTPLCWSDDLVAARLGVGVLTMLEVSGIDGVRILIDGDPHPEAGDGRVLTRADVLGIFGGLVVTGTDDPAGPHDVPITFSGYTDDGADIDWRVAQYDGRTVEWVLSGSTSPVQTDDGSFRFDVTTDAPPCRFAGQALEVTQTTSDGDARRWSIPLIDDVSRTLGCEP